MITIIGATVSPYVRKILAVLTFKGLDFEIDPLVPFFGDDAFAKLPPPEQRAKAAEIGHHLTQKTFFADQPRKGPMTQIGRRMIIGQL